MSDERRAELEAAAAEARDIASVVANDAKFHRIETLIDQLEDAALDRVRDARSGDEAVQPKSRKTHIRIPSVEGRMGFPPDVVKQYKAAARSPQGEDHEAPEFDEQAITDILVAIDDVLEGYGRERMDMIDGPTVDAVRDAVKRELVAFVARAGESNEGGNQ